MKLEIFDKYTRNRIGMVKAYTYASYEDEFFGQGAFSIKMPVHDESLDMLLDGNYVLFEEGVVGIVKGRKDVQEEEEEIEVYGYLVNHILSYRSFFLSTKYYDRIPAVFRRMAQDLFIAPTDPKRKVEGFRLSEDPKYFPEVGSKETVQRTGDTLLEVLADISMTKDLGFRLHPVVEDVDVDSGMSNLSALEFRVIKPAYRTIDNAEGNDPVVFSFDLNNLQGIEYEEDGRAYASMALVASEGEGTARKTLEVGDLDKEGIDRIEVYVDAKDIQSNSGSSEGGGSGEGGSGSGSGGGTTGPQGPPGPQGPQGEQGPPGEDGFSPTITPNVLNSSTDYRLDITTKTAKFTTPNLKGPKGDPGDMGDIDEFLNGLTFGQDAEGKWGYIPPGADTVIPFSKGGESSGSSVEMKDFPNPVIFHPAMVLFGVSVVETEADVVVGSEWKKVDA